MQAPFTLAGPIRFQARSLAVLCKITLATLIRRRLRGPLRPGWSSTLEMAVAYLRAIERGMLRLPSIQEQRAYVDALVFASQSVPHLAITTEHVEGVKGQWYTPRTVLSSATMLYLRGGGYAFDSRSLDNDGIDWIDREMALRWAEWFRGSADPADPMLSPIHADIRGLAPLYIQAGGAEILVDQIRTFVNNARRQGVAIEYDQWEGMPHDFQAYGDLVPQATDALARLATAIRSRTTITGAAR